MKNYPLKAILFSVIFLAQPLLSAHALIVKNPVDLSPTALQNSGASYGPNVVTHVMGTTPDSLSSSTRPNDDQTVTESEVITFDEMPGNAHRVSSRDAIITDPVTDNDDVSRVDTVRSSAVLENPNHVSETTVATDQYALQQQQQMEPNHGSGVMWGIAVFAALIIGGIFYAVRKRDPNTRIN